MCTEPNPASPFLELKSGKNKRLAFPHLFSLTSHFLNGNSFVPMNSQSKIVFRWFPCLTMGEILLILTDVVSSQSRKGVATNFMSRLTADLDVIKVSCKIGMYI